MHSCIPELLGTLMVGGFNQPFATIKVCYFVLVVTRMDTPIQGWIPYDVYTTGILFQIGKDKRSLKKSN